MFLPIGDTPNPRTTPLITYALIAINVALFVLISYPAMLRGPDLESAELYQYLYTYGARGMIPAEYILENLSAYDLLIFNYGFRPADPTLTTLFTSLFLHGGWMHLIGNMLFLWIFGDNVEHRLGHTGYLIVYLASGVAATLFFALFVGGDSQVPLIGASGAISGILGCYFIWFPKNQVKVFIFFFPILMQTILVPARLVLGFYLLIDNLLPFLVNAGGSGGGVAHGAHIGGFLAGGLLAWGLDHLPDWHLKKRARRPVAPSPDEPRPEREPTLAEMLLAGKAVEAANRWIALPGKLDRRATSPDTVIAIGNRLLHSGDYRLALALFRRFIGENPRDPHLDRAFLGAGKALIHLPRSIPAAYHYFLTAVDVTKNADLAEEARMHLKAIEKLGQN